MDRSPEFPSFEGEEDMIKRLFSKKSTHKGQAKPVPARVHSADLDLYRLLFGPLPCDREIS